MTAPRLADHARARLEEFYRDLHEHPELSYQEFRTAAKIAEYLDGLGLEVTTGIARTGVVAVLRNGDGPVVLLRADMDALPVAEQTALPYASTATGTDPDGNDVPVMHACGHDMHVTCQLGALTVLAADAATWSGTVVAVFQPAEEGGNGATAMVEDGLYERFPKPEIVLAQHVSPLPAGMVGYRPGYLMAAADSLLVRLFGVGGHGSQPDLAIDPIVMAAATIMRLQTVRSRELSGTEPAVLTVGSIHAGTKDNIIPDQAELKINLRTFAEETRTRILASIQRIVEAEARASGAPKTPEISPIYRYPALSNDEAATAKTVTALRDAFGDKVFEFPQPFMGSEDAGDLATALDIPIVYWILGGADPEAGEIVFNHSPFFAPLIQPTLDTGVGAMVVAALTWLGPARPGSAESTAPQGV
ncbi:amidohydrolase [Nocardia pseudobrasiliensis]|uniref:Hippurate hydrolase n=1 Tax=Nocardia pseudobrasiliensis TaxID=45979 RepID=A0A370I8B1_9NOCA|nr:amidohydrolase [Nocardia pseudobrasiliensis]RDI66976.1 hippurate hydrolase [Nocardia pseudobrasiliensis]